MHYSSCVFCGQPRASDSAYMVVPDLHSAVIVVLILLLRKVNDQFLMWRGSRKASHLCHAFRLLWL